MIKINNSNRKKYFNILLYIMIFKFVMLLILFVADDNKTVETIMLAHFVLFATFTFIAKKSDKILQTSGYISVFSITFLLYAIFLNEQVLVNLFVLALVLLVSNLYSSHILNWLSFITISSLFVCSIDENFMDKYFEATDVIYYLAVFLSISIAFTLNLYHQNKHEKSIKLNEIKINSKNEELNQLLETLNKNHLKIQQFSDSFDLSMTETTKSISEMSISFSEMKTTFDFQNDNLQSIYENTHKNSEEINILDESTDLILDETKQTRDMIQENKEEVTNLKKLMDTLNTDFIETNKDMIQLTKDMTNISKILSTIDSISNRIKLVALNASIEAARAGEHGKGFKVVSDEVKVLVSLTENASNSISELLNDMIVKTDNLSVKIERSMNEIKKNTEFASSLKSKFDVLNDKNLRVYSEITNVNTSTSNISNATEKIANRLSDFVSINEESASSLANLVSNFEEITMSVNMLNTSFKEMKQEIFD